MFFSARLATRYICALYAALCALRLRVCLYCGNSIRIAEASIATTTQKRNLSFNMNFFLQFVPCVSALLAAWFLNPLGTVYACDLNEVKISLGLRTLRRVSLAFQHEKLLF